MIDKEKIAKFLVSNKELFGCAKRYELACLYCFKSSIEQLWMDLEEKEKKRYREESASPLVGFWASVVGKKMEAKDYIFGFELAVEYGAESSIQYFLDFFVEIKQKQKCYLLHSLDNLMIKNLERNFIHYRWYFSLS